MSVQQEFVISLFLGHQVVANCLSALQEVWSAEASTSEDAAHEREALLSKPVIYYFLNRYALFSLAFHFYKGLLS